MRKIAGRADSFQRRWADYSEEQAKNQRKNGVK
jgi:hypothetical protein